MPAPVVTTTCGLTSRTTRQATRDVAEQVLDAPVRWPVREEDPLVGEQRTSVALVERHPRSAESLPGIAEGHELEQVTAHEQTSSTSARFEGSRTHEIQCRPGTRHDHGRKASIGSGNSTSGLPQPHFLRCAPMTGSETRSTRMETSTPADGIAVVVLTHNRVHLLRRCVENVLLRTRDATREIVIWDNASTDGTAEYLETLDDPRIRVVRSEKNLARTVRARVRADDGAVPGRGRRRRRRRARGLGRDASRRIRTAARRSASWPPTSRTTRTTWRRTTATACGRTSTRSRRGERRQAPAQGPTGGGCAITSRELNERVGGFREDPKQSSGSRTRRTSPTSQRLGLRRRRARRP